MNKKTRIRLIWILLLVGPSIFFFRGILLWLSGGDCMIFTIPITGWFALIIEFITGGISIIGGIYRIFKGDVFFEHELVQKTSGYLTIISIIVSFTLHFVRIGIYLELCL